MKKVIAVLWWQLGRGGRPVIALLAVKTDMKASLSIAVEIRFIEHFAWVHKRCQRKDLNMEDEIREALLKKSSGTFYIQGTDKKRIV